MSDKPVRLRGRGANEPTPYLKKWLPKLVEDGLINPFGRGLDIGAGNGRNLTYLQTFVFRSAGLDSHPPKTDEHHDIYQWDAGRILPANNDEIHVILLQYLLMLLTNSRRTHILQEIYRVATSGCVVIMELQKVKGYPVFLESDIWEHLCQLTPRFRRKPKRIHHEKYRGIYRL